METTGFEALDRILVRVRANSKDLGQNKITTSSQMKRENELKKKDFYECRLCKDTSWIINSTGKAIRCKCFEIQLIKEQWKSSGLETDDLDKTFKTYNVITKEQKALKDTATNYYLRFEKIKSDKYNSILFSGNPGSGKTHLLIAIANKLIKDGYKVVYMEYPKVMLEMKQNIMNNDIYNKMITKYKNADVLLIDDLWKGTTTNADINIMFQIVNNRYINKKPIICSTEYLIEKMLEFDEAIGSRIYEMSKDFIHEVRGQENNNRLKV